ncbi:MAG: pyridoxal phosphate-dependent aminotransferase [Candidatus Atribacteria bacterium]|mgnify:CR=1 FL=1|nr:pyridoxal phosphate-dependent aminotransferase [Candidatus Atribacteria bacterium]
MNKQHYDFDRVISRGDKSGSYSIKWQSFEEKFPGYNIDTQNSLGMWIADMDFLCPPEVISAIKKRAEHGIYGYLAPIALEAFKKAAAGWFERRYDYKVPTDWMLFISGVVPSINAAIQEFSKPGDGIIIQNPVYYPFSNSIKNNGRIIRNNSLIEDKGSYTMNFENLENIAKKSDTKFFILCNPHNPVGRVWTKDELYQACQICLDNGVLVFSDEIHADFIMKDYHFSTAGKLSEEISQNLIISYAPSKTFNIAGLAASLIVVPNPKLRERLAKRMEANNYPDPNVFAPIAGEAAYLYGDNYVSELMEYVEHNFDFTVNFLRENLPSITMKKPEGTYLGWMDFRGTGLNSKEIYSLILEKAKVVVDLGDWFGSEGDGFIRINLACPKYIVIEALQRLKKAFQNL